MARLRSIVVDDEQVARDLLVELLQGIDDVDVIGSYGQSGRAIAAIRREVPDLVFLDIQMRGKSGFDVLSELGPDAPPVVLVTAFEEYALRAFDVDAVDYLLKPVSRQMLERAITRARVRSGTTMNREAERDQGQPRELMKYLPVRIGEQITLVPVTQISFFEASGKHVKIHSAHGEHVMRMTMQSVEKALDPERFIRVSRSAIVNVEQIRLFEPWGRGEWMIVLHSGARVLTTQGFRTRVQQLLRAP